MVCPPPVISSLPLRIVPTIGYGTLKGLVVYLIQNDCTGTSSTKALLTCCALGSLEKFASDLAASSINNLTDKKQIVPRQVASLIHLISELGCKVLVWGVAAKLGFTSLPVALTGGAITGTITLIRKIDDAVVLGADPVHDLTTFFLYGVSYLAFIFAQVNLRQNNSSQLYPLSEGLLLYGWVVFLLGALDQIICRISQHHLKQH